MTPDQYMVETRTILNEHLIACARSNAVHTTILVVGLTAILSVAGFGIKGLYDNGNAQAKSLENTMHELTTRDRIVTTDPQGRTVTRVAP